MAVRDDDKVLRPDRAWRKGVLRRNRQRVRVELAALVEPEDYVAPEPVFDHPARKRPVKPRARRLRHWKRKEWKRRTNARRARNRLAAQIALGD